MSSSFQTYQTLIDQLISAQTQEQLISIISSHEELLIPELAVQLAEQVRTDRVTIELLDFIDDVVRRKLTLQWLNISNDYQEAFLRQYQDWLLSDNTFNFLMYLAESDETNKDFIENRITTLINWGLTTYFASKNETYQQQLLLSAKQLFLHKLIFVQMPAYWARFQGSIGRIFANSPAGDRSANQELAIQAYQRALTVLTQEGISVDWAITLYNLGTVYQERIQGDRSENQELAIQTYQQALTVPKPDIMPSLSRLIATSLGNLFVEIQEWEDARNVFEIAHQATENERQQQNIMGRQRLAEETARLYANLVHVCLQLGDESDAFAFALAAKGRADAERLGEVQSLEQLVAQYPDITGYYQHIRQLQQTLHELGIQLESQAKPPAAPSRLTMMRPD